MTAPDPLFADPRLAAVYDAFDGDRSDLDAYVALVDELDAREPVDVVVDVGCGTGELAVRLAARGLRVVGADPAAASLAVARAKPRADAVRWVEAGAADLAAILTSAAADLALMTGNVAQVFIDDRQWQQALTALSAVVRPGGHLVLETRVPERRAWEGWARDRTDPTSRDVPGVGRVEQRFEVLDVSSPLVSFRWTYRFDDGAEVSSDSTLVFRSVDQIGADLAEAGFDVETVRDAPDRPGLEHVVVARRR